VYSALFAALPSFSKRKKFVTRGRKIKCEYPIQDGGCPGAGIPNILNEYIFYTEIRIPDISATISRSGSAIEQLLKVLGDTKDVARHIPASVGESTEWAAIVNAAEENGASYCKGLHGKPLFSALYGTYTVTLQELKAVLKARTLAGQTNIPKTTGQQTTQEDGLQEVRRRKRCATDETTGTSKKAAVQIKTSPALNIPPKEVVTRMEPGSSREAWRISNPLNSTSTPITSPITHYIPHPKTYEGGGTPLATKYPCKRHI
jgi:hypothetical protein